MTLPLFLVVLVLALMQYRGQREQVRRDLAAASGSHALALNTIARLATDHALQMKTWSESYLGSPPGSASALREHFTPRMTAGAPDGWSLDAVPPDRRAVVGQLLWLGGDPRQPETARVRLDQALDFFGVVRLTHLTTPYFQWSYFFPASRDYLTIYPWTSSGDLIEGMGHASMKTGVPKWFDYEIYTAGTPERNPSRGPYWTAPYLDAAGAGAMVSLGAPVYVQDRFAGVVGTDVKLATLEAFVAQLPREVGRLWVLDAHDQVLADTAGSPRDAMRRFDQVRPPGITDADLASLRAAPGSVVQAGGHTLVARPIAAAPWTLVYSVGEREITGLLWPRLAPYGLILAILAANFFAAVVVLARALEDNRRATRRLRESEAFKSALVDTSPLAIVTTDETGRIVEFNPAAQTVFQRTRDECVGRDMPALLEPLRRVGLRPDGSEFPVEVSTAVNHLGGQRFVTVFIADLSERTRAQEELARQRETLRQSEKLSAMGALLAGVAHELNNPLAILMGRASLLERKPLEASVKADVLKIHAAADRCGRIVRTFLAMARQRPAQRRRAPLREVVAGAVDLVGYNLRSCGIAVDLRIDAPLPALDIDTDQIGQIVVNLLVNAQQALAERPQPRCVCITTRAVADGVSLRIVDNGPGVPPDLRGRIFDPFFTTKTEGTGTGVGLSVSRAIAREHGGELRLVESGQGASFELTLPLAAAASPEAGAAELPASRSTLSQAVALVIDDEPEVARLLCDILCSAGCRAVAMGSGREALRWLDDNACSFILCDVRMPDMDGPAFWRALQDRHPRLLRHLAFVTGDTLSATVSPFLRETGLPSLEKPFTPEEVLGLVARIE